MSRVDNIQARCEDGRIEVGLFEGEECRRVIALRAPEAFELRDSLNDALREAGLLNRKTAASEHHAVELLEVARDVVCARIETVDPARYYERMNSVSERAKRAVETVDHGTGMRMRETERDALAARPWFDQPRETGVAAGKTESSVARSARELVTALESIGFGCDDIEINGGGAVEVINDHLPGLIGALAAGEDTPRSFGFQDMIDVQETLRDCANALAELAPANHPYRRIVAQAKAILGGPAAVRSHSDKAARRGVPRGEDLER